MSLAKQWDGIKNVPEDAGILRNGIFTTDCFVLYPSMWRGKGKERKKREGERRKKREGERRKMGR